MIHQLYFTTWSQLQVKENIRRTVGGNSPKGAIKGKLVSVCGWHQFSVFWVNKEDGDYDLSFSEHLRISS